DIKFALHNLPERQQIYLGEALQILMDEFEQKMAQLSMSFDIVELSDCLSVSVTYCTDLYTSETISRLFGHYRQLLESVVISPEISISKLEMLGSAEREQLVNGFNQTGRDYDLSRTVLELFAGQVTAGGSSVALVFEGQTMSYGELDAASNRLGHYLRGVGVGPESLVGICLERGIDMVVGILGILKSGGAYLPIDPDYPVERIGYMISDSQVSCVVSSAALSGRLPGSCHVIQLDGADRERVGACSSEVVFSGVTSSNLAYVIYTSGSTGRPKGVMIEHRSLVSLIYNQIETLQLHSGITVLQFSSISFDASVYEIFSTLTVGGRLVTVSKETILESARLTELINKEQVELVTLPPSYQIALIEPMPSLRTLVSAGEAINLNVAAGLAGQGITVINAYGPTENTVCATLTNDPLDHAGKIVIGKPLGNNRVYILNDYLEPVPCSLTGEIFLAGDQLARGYLNRTDLTAERFIASPFVAGDR
ncbi:non-ribosomal peptide synthetase, partial [Dyadobacter sp. OTU695]|uniref:non-ribosomal peptide synthetase n=1 Tax=Dyadobacter sp. OTU695 TaxID=3043860 RepID=UPI00313EB428